MTKISQEEVLKIAKMSHFSLRDDEITPMIKQLEEVLSYAERVKEVAAEIEEPSNKNVNFFREDVVVKTDSQAILAQSPAREEDYFVVPAILDTK